MKMTWPALAGLPLPLLAGGAALAALSGTLAPPAAVPAAPPAHAAETAAVADMLDRLPVQYAVADMTRAAERRPGR